MKNLSVAKKTVLVALSVIGFLFSCAPKEDPVDPNNKPHKEDPKVAVTSVTLNQSAATLAIGESVVLTATVSPSNATVINVSWTSSDASVASVSNGKVTAAKEGSATITATAGEKSATCAITVTKGGFPEGKLPASNEIWYTTSDNKPLNNVHKQGSLELVSHQFTGGMGVLKFSDSIITMGLISEDMRECERVTGLLVPDCVEVFDPWAFQFKYSYKEFRIPASFKRTDAGFLSLQGSDLERFTGHFVSEDGRCVVMDGKLVGFAPAGIDFYEIPSGIVTVGEGAFYNAVSLKSVVIPSGVEALEDMSFGYSGLESVTIPASVKSIHEYAFNGCNSLKNLLGDSPFISEDRKFLSKLDGMGWLSLFFFAGRDDTSYVIPEGIESLEFYSFMGCDKLKSITLPSTLKNIKGGDVFEGCVNLEALYGRNTTADHKGYVNDAHILQFLVPGIDDDYVVPDDVTGLGRELFLNRHTLRSVTMGDQVTSIGNDAFAGCTSLTTVTFSANLETIDANPFWRCDALKTVYFRGIVPPVFSGNNYDESLNLTFYVPSQSLSLYQADMGWKYYWTVMKPYEYTDLPKPEYYISSDFSHEGEVTVYQKATEGNGIDVVFMGDAYSDREVADGRYLADMKASAESFFGIEPYKSFRHLFNIYFVTAVSATEGYAHGGRSLGTQLGQGTYMSGNDEKCFKLALEAIKDESRMDEVLVVVCGNQDLSGTIRLSGTCVHYDPSDWNGRDYANGPAVAYFLKQDAPDSFERTSKVLRHEAGGHGFAKLADEYSYAGTSISSRDIDYLKERAPYRWCSNVDITSDPAQVKWSAFISDGRYKSEGIGVYEGGYVYQYGVWRPTQTSIMNDNIGGFNAPSRYTIWYRIHKLAYGKSWNGTYEDFVAYDTINRNASGASSARTKANYVEYAGQHLHQPELMGRTWRQARKAAQ